MIVLKEKKRYNIAINNTKELKSYILDKGVEEVEKLDFDNPFDSSEQFFQNEGWTIDEFKDVEEIEIIYHYGEALYGSAVALDELEYVESEPITDSRPYGRAAECAKEGLENALEHIEKVT